MHVFFSGIGGTAIGPLAQIAYQAGLEVSGSDKQSSQYISYLRNQGITNIHIGQTEKQIAAAHQRRPIDWYVYSSALAFEQPDGPEQRFCEQQHITTTKRDAFLAHFLQDHNLSMIAVAGTHGKTTTTAMAIWLLQQLTVPISYSVGAKLSFGDMGHYDPTSQYFVYEADEFDYNFLAFSPLRSLITGVDYDHHEIFPTAADYQQAFVSFIEQSDGATMWETDVQKLTGRLPEDRLQVLDETSPETAGLTLAGAVNRKNAWQTIQGLQPFVKQPVDELVTIMNQFPGVSRRFEKLADNLYSDYAHTIEKIKGCLQTANEISSRIVVVYEPLTNRRQHHIKQAYTGLFQDVAHVYWVPSYLAREDGTIQTYTPEALIQAAQADNATPAQLDDALWEHIQRHRSDGDTVVIISGGGGDSLDEWVRQRLNNKS